MKVAETITITFIYRNEINLDETQDIIHLISMITSIPYSVVISFCISDITESWYQILIKENNLIFVHLHSSYPTFGDSFFFLCRDNQWLIWCQLAFRLEIGFSINSKMNQIILRTRETEISSATIKLNENSLRNRALTMISNVTS